MSREARKAQNEVWFRELNERLEQRALERVGPGEPFRIVCECALEECTAEIRIAPPEYESVRSDPTRFILAHGHADPAVERVVSRTDGYEIVMKTGEAALVAEREDPRG